MTWIFYILTSILWAQPTVYVEGVITSYDQKTITLRQKNGAIVKVPRSVYKKTKGIVVGKENVMLQVAPSEWIRLNPKLLEKKQPVSH